MHYSLTRATLWNLLGYSYLIIASFISLPLIISSLGVGEFARYSLIIATTTLASSLDLGLSQAVIRKLSQKLTISATADRHDRQSIWTTSFILFLSLGIIVATVASLLTLSLHAALAIFLIILLNHLLTHYLTLPQAYGRFDLYNLKTFLVGTANTFLSAYLAIHGHDLYTILLFQALSYLVTLLLLHLYSTRNLAYSRFSSLVAKQLLNFGYKNQAGKLVSQLQAQYPKLLIAPLGALPLSAYSVAQSLILKLAGALTQLSSALYPASSRNAHSASLRQLYHRLQLSLVIISALGIALYKYFGPYFIYWWLGSPELAGQVVEIINLLVWYLALLVLTPLPSVILDSHNRPGTTSLLGALAFFLELILAVVLIPHFSYLAPAYAGVISLLIFIPILLVVTEKTLNLSGNRSQSGKRVR